MLLIHQSNDGNGATSYLPVNVPAGVELVGEMRVPGSLIFNGVERNPHCRLKKLTIGGGPGNIVRFMANMKST